MLGFLPTRAYRPRDPRSHHFSFSPIRNLQLRLGQLRKEAKTVLQCYQQASSDLYLFVNVSLTGFVGPVPAV